MKRSQAARYFTHMLNTREYNETVREARPESLMLGRGEVRK